MNNKEILIKCLKDNNYDGLCNIHGECMCCFDEDIFGYCSDESLLACQPGVKIHMEKGEHKYFPDQEWEIVEKIEEVTRRKLMEKPKIITLCGSSKFIKQFAILAWTFEKYGAIVLGLHLLPDSYFDLKDEDIPTDHIAEYEGVADEMDELHLRKIDISDSIFIVNVNGYIGDSTRREIAYAKRLGKPITYLNHLKYEVNK